MQLNYIIFHFKLGGILMNKKQIFKLMDKQSKLKKIYNTQLKLLRHYNFSTTEALHGLKLWEHQYLNIKIFISSYCGDIEVNEVLTHEWGAIGLGKVNIHPRKLRKKILEALEIAKQYEELIDE